MIYQITTKIATNKSQFTTQKIPLSNGNVLDFYFYQNLLTGDIGFNLKFSGYVFDGYHITDAENMLYPFNFLGRLYVVGDYPTVETIDNTSILYFDDGQ